MNNTAAGCGVENVSGWYPAWLCAGINVGRLCKMIKKQFEAEITTRLQKQVTDLESAVECAKREAFQLFRELNMRMKKAKNIASELDSGGNVWARKVSKLMDILGSCRDTMDGMTAIGLVRDSGSVWDLERVFDGAENN